MGTTLVDPVKISPDADINVRELFVDQYAVINKGFRAHCRKLHIGRHCWIGEDVQIGLGASGNPWSDVVIGDYTGLMDRVLLNPSRAITIGKGCGLGVETQVWTHSGWLPIADGFPAQNEKPVIIGDNVWLPSRCQVLPGVQIGSNVVVGIGSLVNRSLPDGCLAAGRPCTVKRERVYPRPVTVAFMRAQLGHLIGLYQVIANDKGFSPVITVEPDAIVRFEYANQIVRFDPWGVTFDPVKISDYAEDFRDYLRRYGIKFFGGGFFRSLPYKGDR